ncbi:3-hydroxyacyl-[acyl-carrier-protein] dehydratase [Rhizomicrobium palustre]|uniref:3-hydroxyacyl-[acyl-carrier-protein] dehydratase FabZ n=1 Tax=Rhizomicrobium palustre TaxID=189966 RepID=A0A846N283_9PROT|nr:3-hydroxyacyl-ACP dehydratase FabZ [Rhizomicrobium palustre]NIK89595.1 3-hydroxyacyl-[acyl-carrier-protein] dehydratase [Rhizomicrobium palustre]
MSDEAEKVVLDSEAIMRLIPHRHPMLMVEKLTDIVPHQSATGYKAVSFNEPHFAGHFPGHPVMPGVLIVEALAQTAGAMVMYSIELSSDNRVVYFMTIEKARFRRPVRPGDMLEMKVKALRRRGPVWRFSGEAFVDGALCAEAEFSAMIYEGTADNGGSSDGNR